MLTNSRREERSVWVSGECLGVKESMLSEQRLRDEDVQGNKE